MRLYVIECERQTKLVSKLHVYSCKISTDTNPLKNIRFPSLSITDEKEEDENMGSSGNRKQKPIKIYENGSAWST